MTLALAILAIWVMPYLLVDLFASLRKHKRSKPTRAHARARKPGHIDHH